MQPGFFDHEERLAQLETLGDPLPQLDRVVDWEGFRPIIEGTRPERDPGTGGRPWTDPLLMFKLLVLQQLYNLSDDQTEYQVRDRYSFSRFLDLSPEDRVPDAKTIWAFRERLKQAQVLDALWRELDRQIGAAGFRARQGQIVDASIVQAPRQRNTRSENQQIKRGETPTDWSEAKRRQKDTQARWTYKDKRLHYGYKNHISVDVKHKLIRRFAVSDAALNDRHKFEAVLDPNNSSRAVWADANYRSRAQEGRLREQGYRSYVQRQGQAKRPLSERQQAANRRRSKTRIRVEHVFAHQQAMGRLIRTIGLARAEFKIGLMNMVYNMRRLAFLSPNPP